MTSLAISSFCPHKIFMTAEKTIFKKLLGFLGKIPLTNVLTSTLVTAIILSSAATYLVIANPDLLGVGFDPSVQSTLLLFNLTLLLFLTLLISRKLFVLWRGRDKKVGSRLLLRIIFMFSLVAIIPAVIVGLSSTFYLNMGIKSWFDERVNRAVIESVEVADAYLIEHKRVIQFDALNLANEIGNNSIRFAFSKERLERFLEVESNQRLLSDIVVFEKDSVIASSRLSYFSEPEKLLENYRLEDIAVGEIITLPYDKDKVLAITRIPNFNEVFLLVGRYVDPKVVAHTKETRGAAEEYLRLKRQIAEIQVNSTIFFLIIAGLLLLGAIWIAFRFANSLVEPISKLVAATDRIKRGEYAVRVGESKSVDEIGVLSRSFNQMAAELESQKRGIIIANREADEKSQFSQAVLSGISSGVVAINEDKKIELLNSSAKETLALGDNAIGKYLRDAIPEFADVFAEFEKNPLRPVQKQVSMRRKSKKMTCNVRINPHIENNTEGYIMTFDDITELLSAQRSSAWSDVARRIAHEIKNPLTPINLSAQRLAKKFRKHVPEEELENFVGYTDTIARHTSEIARIIGEFSDFAKLPSPRFQKTDLSKILKDSVFSSRVAYSKIDFTLDMPDQIEVLVDSGQLSQVMTNILKNASESVSENREKGGKISVLASVGDEISITVEDNGGGFPPELLDRLTEPYVTTRAKGTGLGLAIVKKIIEDHSGKIELGNKRKGARVVITLPISG